MTSPSSERRRDADVGRELDARVAEALGYKAWTEKRGEYTLCVVQEPSERDPWMRTQDSDEAKKRYTPVSCAKAARIGFFGSGFPRFSIEIAAAWLVVEKLAEDFEVVCGTYLEGAVVMLTRHETIAPIHRVSVDPRDGGMPLAICRAALAVYPSGEETR